MDEYSEIEEKDSIYGKYGDTLPLVMEHIVAAIKQFNDRSIADTGHPVYEHLIYRIKSDVSMRDKCRRRGLPETPVSALKEIRDAIGIRIVTGYVDDIYAIIRYLKEIPGCRIIIEKDYIKNSKPNGYRSYHMILEMTVPYEDVSGANPGRYSVEVQLRTIAMDSWASLEHELKYKQEIGNEKMIVAELKRVADELASCDLTMQTIRNLIRQG
ncbi:MAG: GTP pyrophosphokinase family protein [Lachnospiraceae bacterium]|nr:GTP pyrophosphokinase family protein [Lachnospiraceae bacterium]